MNLVHAAKRLGLALVAVHAAHAGTASAQVDPDTAYFLERVAALGLVEQVLVENPLLEDWEEATLDRTDTWLYHDPIGQPAFYEVGVLLNGERAGRVKVAANPAFGSPFLSVEMTPRPWSVDAAAWLSAAGVAAGHPNATLLHAVLVAYDGLKTGIVILYDDPTAGGFGFEVWDLTTLTRVPEENLRSNLLAIPPGEVQERYELFVQELDYVLAVDAMLVSEDVPLVELYEAAFDPSDWLTLQQVNGALLTTEPHVTLDLTRCQLYLQEMGDWCVPAFHQMINHYYQGGPLHTQTQIDTLLQSFGWAQDWILAMQSYFTLYDAKTDSEFEPIPSSAPTADIWPGLKAEIDADRPLGLYTSDTSTAHMAMCIGYQEVTKDLPAGVGIGGDVLREYWLHVYDPGVGMFTAKAWKGDISSYPGKLAGYFVVK